MTKIHIKSPAEFRKGLNEGQMSAFDRHLYATKAIFDMTNLRYFEDEEKDSAKKLKGMIINPVAPITDLIGGLLGIKKDRPMPAYEMIENLSPADQLDRLRGEMVRSVLLGFWMDDQLDTAAERDEMTKYLTLPSEEDRWKIKPNEDPFKSKTRFFVAKTALGLIELEDATATMVERRTFATYGIDDAMPRAADVREVLGVGSRHPRDTREVVLAPTTVSYYVYKDVVATSATSEE